MKRTQVIPIIESLLPPCIVELQDVFYACPGFHVIDESITLEQLRSKWKPIVPIKHIEEAVADNVYPVLSSKGDQEYYVTIITNSYSCTCVGYGFRRKCKHIDEVKLKLKS